MSQKDVSIYCSLVREPCPGWNAEGLSHTVGQMVLAKALSWRTQKASIMLGYFIMRTWPSGKYVKDKA